MKKQFVLLALSFSLAACQSIKLNPEASLVRLTHEEPKNCQFLGDVTGNQGDQITGVFTSNADMETGARNDLKNKAKALGGNTVYLLTNRAGQTGSWDDDLNGQSVQTNVTLTGGVYSCE